MKPWPQNAIALICCRVGDPFWNGKPGSVVQNCFNCDHEIMAAPESQARKAAGGSEYVCVECYRLYTDGKPHILIRPLEGHTEPQKRKS